MDSREEEVAIAAELDSRLRPLEIIGGLGLSELNPTRLPDLSTLADYQS